MLKAIELYGFKSFADRTRMELEAGVCALVGPNGSGKSNVVDAIKWALGEQSAKRLRGDEMTDVIFNGSESRSSLGTAEVTLTFDNSKRLFAFEGVEFHLTRRVYRSGESEYLINGQASRLKDFRDLICGVGLGAQGYAVIEQGRVEALLQSSSLQRRAVLEEAAGVSRFNAKKQEVTRRLERVEQNLLRLSDLVGEVESQLRRAKTQAGKAERYRQYTTRLQKLRLEASLYEWRLKSAERERISVETNDFAVFEADSAATIARAEAEQTRLTQELAGTEERLRVLETELSTVRERIVADESSIEFQTTQIAEWREESATCALQAYRLRNQGAQDDHATAQTRAELADAQGSVTAIETQFQTEQTSSSALIVRVEELQGRQEELQRKRDDLNGQASRFDGEISGLEARRRSIEQSYEQKCRQLSEASAQQQELAQQVDQLKTDGDQLDKEKETSFQRLNELKRRREELRRDLAAKQVEFSDLENKRAVFDERSSLLNDLLRKYEGLSPGVKETLRSMKNSASPFRNAYGLVADLIRVNVEAAPLIELALGPTAQYVVVPPEPELFRYIERQGSRFAGRVGFIWLDPNPSKSIPLDPKLNGRAGVLGRADQFVETEPMFATLVQRLLYRTWIVESVAVAKQLYREVDEPTSFLAADGSLLSADGTLVVGSAQGSAGLISRRSELAALSKETVKLEENYERLRTSVLKLKEELEQIDTQFDAEATRQRETTQRLEALRLRQSASQERDAQLLARLQQLQNESQDLKRELDKLESEIASKNALKTEFEHTLTSLDTELTQTQNELEQLGVQRQTSAQRTTNLKIELAKAQERIVLLSERLKRLEDSQAEQLRRASERMERAQSLRERLAQSELTTLNLEAALALNYATKDALTAERTDLAYTRAQLESQRAKASYLLKSSRAALEQRREQIRAKELSRERFAQELKTLEERMREDYGVDLADVSFRLEEESATQPEGNGAVKTLKVESTEETRELVVPIDKTGLKLRKKEIEELRVKLQELGSVNLEAIETLETLKTRYATLFNQYNDLIAARKSIQKIIERVNADCKRLFEETFQGVRERFCTIFQTLFGGGRADLTLETPSNPLESGVDIVARPPGKELKSLTLMSGGEKSLTCVALLLAIFQYRPSPICILDEVDAALDEGNVGRFANALQGFIPETQFLLVTHSKKTMSAAKSIYGVTMEDSGVSKILSVRFDDVGEDGEILIQAPSRQAGPRLAQDVA
ncbi:MAG: chromosome segregation protein SMC [Planctomycetia bacterium]|nr:chromosome segregation protein SMC [Planctomycetia bacterium]